MSWNEQDHPRVSEGKTGGGQFTTKEGIDRAGKAAQESAGLTKGGWRSGKHDLELAKKFIEARDQLAKDKIGYLSDYTPEELARSNKELFLHEDGMNGFALEDGDLQNLFSVNHQGGRSILVAIEKGAKTLDCFDPWLPKRYAEFGFVEYKREANWTAGGPDVVYMRLKEKK